MRVLFLAIFAIMLSHQSWAGIFEDELSRALNHSKAIEAAHENLKAAQASLPIARDTLAASADLSVSGSASETSSNQETFEDSNVTTTSLTIKKPIYDGGVASAREKVARLTVTQAEVGLALEEQAVLLESIEAYVGLIIARDRVELEEVNRKRLDEYLRVTEARVSTGDATEIDLSATKARRARAEANLITAETELENALRTYKSKIGNQSPPLQLDMPNAPKSLLPSSDENIGTLALTRNLVHQQVVTDERIARYDLEVVVAAVRPKLDVELSARNREGSSDLSDSDQGSANLTLKIPLYSGGTPGATARARLASHRAALLRLTDSERNTRLEAENTFRVYTAAGEVITAYEAELEAAELLRDGTEREVTFGLKTIRDLLDAEQDMVTAKVNLLTAHQNEILAAFRVLATLGELNAEILGLTPAPKETSKRRSPLRYFPYPRLKYPN